MVYKCKYFLFILTILIIMIGCAKQTDEQKYEKMKKKWTYKSYSTVSRNTLKIAYEAMGGEEENSFTLEEVRLILSLLWTANKNYDLEERTLEFAKEIIRLCKSLPKDVINRELVAQLVRAGGSVGANYREANDALSKKDFIYRMRIARKEAKECLYWLQLAIETNPEFRAPAEGLLKEAEELKRILSSIITKSR